MVMHVVSTIANSCKNVIMDNWFPNTQLARDNKITMIGTLQGNKCEIPPQFVNTTDREVCSSLLDFKRS
jgi:hypothetical protein